MENQQVKNNEQIIDNSSFNNKKNDLDYLKKLGDIARDFQEQYNAAKQEESKSTYQVKK